MSKVIAIQGDFDINVTDRLAEALEFRGNQVQVVEYYSEEYSSELSRLLDYLAYTVEVFSTGFHSDSVYLVKGLFAEFDPDLWEKGKTLEIVSDVIDSIELRVDHILRLQTQPVDVVNHAYEFVLKKICPNKDDWFNFSTIKLEDDEVFEKCLLVLQGWLKDA